MLGGMFGQTARPVMGGYNGESNAAKGKGAADASVAAKQASAITAEGDGDSHGRAADAHREAAWKQQDAGNGDKAKWHRAQGQVHQEKADDANRMKFAADDQARAAEGLSKKAEMAGFGRDSNDPEPRSEKQLHEDAGASHKKAADLYTMAGKKRQALYHGAKAEAHASMHGALK